MTFLHEQGEHALVLPRAGHATIKRSLFTLKETKGILGEVMDRRYEINEVFPRGAERAKPWRTTQRALHEAGLIYIARTVEVLGNHATGLANGGLGFVANAGVEAVRPTRPRRNRLGSPALRAQIIIDGVSTIKTGGISVLGHHLFTEAQDMLPGDVLLGHEEVWGIAPLTGVDSGSALSFNLDFIHTPDVVRSIRTVPRPNTPAA